MTLNSVLLDLSLWINSLIVFYSTFNTTFESLGMKSKVSSANCRWVITTLSFPISTPLIKPLDVAWFITKISNSPIMVNKKDDIGSPYLKPFLILTGYVEDLLTKTQSDVDLTHHINHLLILSPNPIWINMCSKKIQPH